MYEPAYSKDENLRLECLDKAVMATESTDNPRKDQLVDLARKFEEFVKNGETSRMTIRNDQPGFPFGPDAPKGGTVSGSA